MSYQSIKEMMEQEIVSILTEYDKLNTNIKEAKTATKRSFYSKKAKKTKNELHRAVGVYDAFLAKRKEIEDSKKSSETTPTVEGE